MKRALFYSAIAIALLYVVRELEYVGLRKNEGGEFAKLRVVFEEKNNFDLVILGSSRAECQFYTPIIDSATGLKSYNLGMTGAVMPLIAATFEAYLENSAAPRYVILNLDLHSLSDNTDTVYRFPRYFAFLDNEKLYEGLQSRDSRFFWFKYIPLYSMPYYNNRYISNSIRGWINKPSKYNVDYELGFAPSITDTFLGDLDTATLIGLNTKIPEVVWNGFLKLHQLCKERKCQLIIVVSPLFHRQEQVVQNYTEVLQKFKSYAVQEKIPLLDLGLDSIRFEDQFYADPAHLNKSGARKFTRTFCSAVKQYLVP